MKVAFGKHEYKKYKTDLSFEHYLFVVKGLKSKNRYMSREQIIRKLGDEGLVKAYRNLGVIAVYLYGSYARGEPSPFSDVDIAVLLTDDIPVERYLDVELELMDNISRILGHPEVEVRVLNKTPVVFRYEIVRDGRLSYCCDEDARVEFEANTMLEYFDFKHVLDEYYHHLAKRIEEGRMTD